MITINGLQCDTTEDMILDSITLEGIKVLSKEQLKLLISRCINLLKSEKQILNLITEKYKHLLNK